MGICALSSCVSLACSSVDPNEATSETTQRTEDASVVYSLVLDDASVVDFHDFGSGVSGLSARGPDSAPTIRNGLRFAGDFVRTFERLRPGEPVPPALELAQERLAAVWREQSPTTGAEELVSADQTNPELFPGELVGEVPSTRILHQDHEWYEDAFCTTDVLVHTAPYGVVSNCELHKTSDGTANSNKVREAHGGVYPYKGSVRMIVDYSFVYDNQQPNFVRLFNQMVPQGIGQLFWVYHPSINMYVMYYAIDTSGDIYHRSRVYGPAVTCANNCFYNGASCLCPR